MVIQQQPIVIKGQPNCILPKSFFEGRFITRAHPESLDYEQWWDEQIKRCKEGWSDGGYTVTGVNYYHLNFKKITMLARNEVDVITDHPYFSFEDQELFNDIRDARAAKKHMALLTGRGWGKSFDVTSLIEHEFIFKPASESVISASLDDHAKKTWSKLELSFNNLHPEIKPNFLTATDDEFFSGYKLTEEAEDGTTTEGKDGFFSRIDKVVFDKVAGKTRGGRPSLWIWEECGSWTGAATLIACYKKTQPSWWRGKTLTCFSIFIGTGGEMDSGGSADFKKVFFSPSTYNIQEFFWDSQPIGKFFPAYTKFGGFYEDSGESDKHGAKEFLEGRRESYKNDSELYHQETMEFPFDPYEAFKVTGISHLPKDLMEKRFAQIEKDPVLKKIVQRGDLDWVRQGSKIIGVKWRQDPNGPFEIAEHPVWTRDNWLRGEMADLYVSGCDSFDAVLEENSERQSYKSKGSCVIFKRFYDIEDTGRLFVAKITQRTNDDKEFYWNTVKLNLYYSSLMLAEYTKLGIFRHYIEKGFEHLLYKRPKLHTTIVKNSTATNTYGIVMPIEVKEYVIKRLGGYYREYMDIQYFQSLLKDGMDFSFDGHEKNKHDETMAASLAVLADGDMYNIEAGETEKPVAQNFPKFVRDQFGNLVFK